MEKIIDVAKIKELWVPEAWPDTAGGAYAGALHKNPYSYFQERVRHLGISGSLLVDAGCGTGTWSFAFAPTFAQVLGVDFNKDRIGIARWLADRFDTGNTSFHEGDVLKLPVQDGAADAIFCNSVLLSGGLRLQAAYSEFYRALKPGGVCYIGLNGLGYGYWLLRQEDKNLQEIGAKALYNTICQTRLSDIKGKIAGNPKLKAKFLAALEKGSLENALRVFPRRSASVKAIKLIENDLGGAFADLLRSDFLALAKDTQHDFSHANAGRGYTHEEVAAASAAAGFTRFESAPDAHLSIQADGSVAKVANPRARAAAIIEFEGHPRVFETLSWKGG